VVSQYAGASVNLVKEGVNGHVIDPHDTASYASVLERLIKTPAAWPAMGEASRRLAEKYCVRKVAAETAGWIMQFV
jgi:glycosyltransferase involved in cell wall biosynthesis